MSRLNFGSRQVGFLPATLEITRLARSVASLLFPNRGRLASRLLHNMGEFMCEQLRVANIFICCKKDIVAYRERLRFQGLVYFCGMTSLVDPDFTKFDAETGFHVITH
jgi:hypothetical protein